MSDCRQMQELQEEQEREAISALMKVAFQGCEQEAQTLAAQLGLTTQFNKEIQHGTHG